MKCFGIATPAIVTIVQYVEDSRPMSLVIAALTILLTVVVAFIATLIIGFEDVVDEDEADEDVAYEDEKVEAEVEESGEMKASGKETAVIQAADEPAETFTIPSPLAGKQIPLSEVKDATFANEVLGKGTAVIPSAGTVAAPFDGTVSVMFETGHAVGLVSDTGIELIIHVGIDTVNLKGRHFHPLKRTGDTVKRGEMLLTFDVQEILDAGYDITTPVIVSNTDRYREVASSGNGTVAALDPILSVRRIPVPSAFCSIHFLNKCNTC